MWAHQAAPQVAASVRAYRAGYRPEERRAIEQGLFQERLLGVVSTSALELGIDIGGLDACLLVGYPGSIASTWQRGGRVGRAGQEALIILIALPDALDQYFMRHPEDFFARRPEAAVIDPGNRRILRGPPGGRRRRAAAAAGRCGHLRGGAGQTGFASWPPSIGWSRAPTGPSGTRAAATRRGRSASARSESRSPSWTRPARPSAAWTAFGPSTSATPAPSTCTRASQFEVTALDLAQRKVQARPVEVDYYTQTSGEKETEILQCQEVRQVKRTRGATRAPEGDRADHRVREAPDLRPGPDRELPAGPAAPHLRDPGAVVRDARRRSAIT